MNEENNYSVYIHVFPNGKVYIGITSRKPEVRWGCNGYLYHRARMKTAIKKYGWSNIEHYILESGINKEQAEELEMKLIKSHRSNEKEFGYNTSIGGDNGCLGYKHSEESKKKMKGHIKTKKEIEKRKQTIKDKYYNGRFRTIPIHYVLQMDLENNIIKVWDNVCQAENELHFYNRIRKCCNFGGITVGGYKFRYAEDFDKQYTINRGKKV